MTQPLLLDGVKIDDDGTALYEWHEGVLARLNYHPETSQELVWARDKWLKQNCKVRRAK